MNPVRFGNSVFALFDKAKEHLEQAADYNNSVCIRPVYAARGLAELASALKEDRVELTNSLTQLNERLDKIEARLSKSPLSSP